jgi:hypothetical protein
MNSIYDNFCYTSENRILNIFIYDKKYYFWKMLPPLFM